MLYGTEACPVMSRHKHSLDFAVNRVLWKFCILALNKRWKSVELFVLLVCLWLFSFLFSVAVIRRKKLHKTLIVGCPILYFLLNFLNSVVIMTCTEGDNDDDDYCCDFVQCARRVWSSGTLTVLVWANLCVTSPVASLPVSITWVLSLFWSN